MPEICFMFYLGEVHTMVSFETLKAKSHYISIICFFKGRMLWNGTSCIVCIVISMEPPPDSDFQFLFWAGD